MMRLIVFMISLVISYPSFCKNLWIQNAERIGIDPRLLYAVALMESAKRHSNSTVQPWPYAIGHTNGSEYPADAETAKNRLRHLLDTESDTKKIDIGLMQINLYWHKHRINNPEELLIPETNLHIATDILAEALNSSPNNLIIGLGRYHSFDENRASEYGKRVLNIYTHLVQIDNFALFNLN